MQNITHLSFTSFLRVFNMVPMQLKSKSQDSFKQRSNFLMQLHPSLQQSPTQIYQMHSNANVRCKLDQAISLHCLHQTPAFPTEVQSFLVNIQGSHVLSSPFNCSLFLTRALKAFEGTATFSCRIASQVSKIYITNTTFHYIILFVDARHY